MKNPDHKLSYTGQKLLIYPLDSVGYLSYLWKGNLDENSQIVIQNDGTFKEKVTYRVDLYDWGVVGTFKVNKQGKANKIVYLPF